MESVSVIIPLYNKEDSIGKTIESILNQTHPDLELIIVNDGSTDRSLDVVRAYQDRRIRIIDKPNEGVSKTRNRGAEEASSELLFFLDADDYIFPDCLETLLKLRTQYPEFDLWSANYVKQMGEKQVSVLSSTKSGSIEAPHKDIYNKSWHFRTGSYIITKKSFFSNGAFPTDMTIGEDWFFMDRYCETFRCAYTPSIVMSYVQESRVLSKSNVDLNKTIEWHFDFEGKNRWQIMSYSENIFKRLIISLMHLRIYQACALISKYHGWVLLGIYPTIMSTIKKYK